MRPSSGQPTKSRGRRVWMQHWEDTPAAGAGCVALASHKSTDPAGPEAMIRWTPSTVTGFFFFLLMLNQNVSRESQIWGPWLESGGPWTGIKINVTISVFSMESCTFLAPNFTANLNKTKLNTICDQYFFG